MTPPQAYREIFEGRWEDWDPFKAGPRIRAAEAAPFSSSPEAVTWGGDASSTSPVLGDGATWGIAGGGTPQAFRPFQGYLSFGRWGEFGNVSNVVCCARWVSQVCQNF